MSSKLMALPIWVSVTSRMKSAVQRPPMAPAAKPREKKDLKLMFMM